MDEFEGRSCRVVGAAAARKVELGRPERALQGSPPASAPAALRSRSLPVSPPHSTSHCDTCRWISHAVGNRTGALHPRLCLEVTRWLQAPGILAVNRSSSRCLTFNMRSCISSAPSGNALRQITPAPICFALVALSRRAKATTASLTAVLIPLTGSSMNRVRPSGRSDVCFRDGVYSQTNNFLPVLKLSNPVSASRSPRRFQPRMRAAEATANPGSDRTRDGVNADTAECTTGQHV